MTKILTASERHANIADALARIERARSSPAEIARLFADGDFASGLTLFVVAENAGALTKILTAAMAALVPAVSGEKAAAAEVARKAADAKLQIDAKRAEFDRRYNHPGNAQRLLAEYLRGQNTPGATSPSELWWTTAGKAFCRPGDRDANEPDFVVTEEIEFGRFMRRVSADYNRWRDHGGHDQELRNAMGGIPAKPTLLRAG